MAGIDTTSPHYKGQYATIYDVNAKYPAGGADGDYVDIGGWAHYWNADRGTWCVNEQRDTYWDEVWTGLAHKVQAQDEALKAERQARLDGDAALKALAEQEQKEREAQDLQLRNDMDAALDAERKARTQGDADVRKALDAEVQAEAAARADGDRRVRDDLDAALDAERKARMQGDEELRATDRRLDERIDALVVSVPSMEDEEARKIGEQ